MAQIETLHLGLQVGVLAARNLIAINVGHRSLQVGLELHVPFPNVCPVIGQLLEIHHIQTGITLLAFQGGNHCVQRGLTGQGAHGGNCQVHNVHAGFGSHQAGGNLVAGGVVGMQVNRNIQRILQARDQDLCRIGLQQAGHILDGHRVTAQILQLLRQIHIVLQRVLIAGQVRHIAGVADGTFHELVLLQCLVDSDFHAGQPVQGVENTEHVNAALCGQADDVTSSFQKT